MSRILVVDDEQAICWSFKQLLTEDGHQVATASTAEEAIKLASRTAFDVAVLDVRLPGIDGLAAMPLLREKLGDVPIVVMTAFGDLETAVRAVEAKAFDYLIKPFNLDQAAEVVRRALAAAKTTRAHVSLVPSAAAEDGAMIGSSPAMQSLFKAIAMVAAADVPVLVTGESGTGKELVARCFTASARGKRPVRAGRAALAQSNACRSRVVRTLKGSIHGRDRRTKRGLRACQRRDRFAR